MTGVRIARDALAAALGYNPADIAFVPVTPDALALGGVREPLRVELRAADDGMAELVFTTLTPREREFVVIGDKPEPRHRLRLVETDADLDPLGANFAGLDDSRVRQWASAQAAGATVGDVVLVGAPLAARLVLLGAAIGQP